MKMVQRQQTGVGVQGDTRSVQAQGLSRTAKETKEIDNRFDLLLDDMFRHVQDKGNVPFVRPPVDHDHLQYLVHAIQATMKCSLFGAVFGEDEDNAVFQTGEPLRGLVRKDIPVEQYLSCLLQDGEKTGHMPSSPDVDQIVDHAAHAYGVDKGLITAVIKAESNFDPRCTSAKGAMGLMQLMPETAEDLGVQNAYDPVENVMGGTRYLKSLLDRYEGDIPLALAAYNWGMGNVERHPGRLPRETRVYITRVGQYYQEGTA